MSQTPGTPSADEPQFTVPIPQSDGTRPLPQERPESPASPASSPAPGHAPWPSGPTSGSSGQSAAPTAVQPSVAPTAPQPPVSPYSRPDAAGNSSYGAPAPANSGYGNSNYGNSGYGNSGQGSSGQGTSGYGNASSGYSSPAAATPAYSSASAATSQAASPLRAFGLVLFGMGLGFWALVATRAIWIITQRGNNSQLFIQAIDSVPEETVVGTSLAILGALVLLVSRRSGGRSGASSPFTWFAVLVAAGSVAALVWRLI